MKGQTLSDLQGYVNITLCSGENAAPIVQSCQLARSDEWHWGPRAPDCHAVPDRHPRLSRTSWGLRVMGSAELIGTEHQSAEQCTLNLAAALR